MIINLIKDTFLYVINTLIYDAVPLLFGITVACILNVYVDTEKFKGFLLKRKRVSILASVAFGTFTPLCACGTMAVTVAMLTTVLPWGPIMAFLTSSPLMSPDLFVMLAGIISVKFAVILTVASLLIGITAGYLSYYLEKHTKFFDNQTRFINNEVVKGCEVQSGCCTIQVDNVGTLEIESSECCESKEVCNAKNSDTKKVNGTRKNKCTEFIKKYKLRELMDVFINLGVKKILVYFSVFAAIGYLINRFVPTSIIVSLFGSENIFSVPLAAIIGIPLYVSDSSSIPLLKSFMDAGASGGAVLAFMITGPGTSIGAIVGSFTIMKRKAVFFYVSILFFSAIVFGYIYNFLLLIG